MFLHFSSMKEKESFFFFFSENAMKELRGRHIYWTGIL